MKRILSLIFCSAICSLSVLSQDLSKMDAFITELMSRMTLQEKLGQLNQLNGGDIQTGAPTQSHIGKEVAAGRVGSVLNTQGVEKILALQKVAVEQSRLGIPVLVGLDVIHGHQTLFPVPLGMASTWDMEGIRESARIAATEASANGIAWTFSPMVDISLDSRWGRQSESAGEDPFLGAQVAKAMVEGYQPTILACAKHFALYGAVEAGRDYNYVDMSRQRMYNQYFAGYRAAAQAGAGSFMTSFNTVDGMPASGNRWLLTDVLRKQWGFKGFVVTDYATITEMPTWGVGDIRTNTACCLRAGSDMDMVSESYIRYLPELLQQGKVTMQDIDLACRRILEAKYRLGLFENPYRFGNPELATKVTYCDEHRKVARRLTAESFVLLKNDNILPLSRKSRIALIGPLADNRDDMAGSWAFSAAPQKYKTLYEALVQSIGAEGSVTCTQGCNVLDDAYLQKTVSEGHGVKPVPFVDEKVANEQALRIARDADVIVCAMGEVAWMNGEGTSRTDLEMPAPQRRLLMKLRELGKPIVLLNFAGRATAIRWESENLDAIMNIWYGSECGDAIADVLFGDVAPSGRLTVSMPKTTGQEPLYYNHMNTGRPVADNKPFWVFTGNYIDVQNGPLYPFGYGLTYTTFQYGKMSVKDMVASVTVTNTGKRAGDEVVQLYIRDIAASTVRPVMELKGFQRIHLQAGESQTVSFPITSDMLSFYNQDLQYVMEPGDFEIMIGPDCKHVQKAVVNIPEPDTRPVINVIGDSYVANHRCPKQETWHYKLAQELNLRYNNYGKNGACVAFDRTHDGKFNFGPAMYTKTGMMDSTASYVLIIGGHNDAVKVGNNRDSLLMFRDSLQLLITNIRHQCPHAQIRYVTPWYVDRPGFAQVCKVIRQVCKKERIPVLDNYSADNIIQVRNAQFRQKYFQRADDTAHLNNAGHDLFLTVARKWFQL